MRCACDHPRIGTMTALCMLSVSVNFWLFLSACTERPDYAHYVIAQRAWGQEIERELQRHQWRQQAFEQRLPTRAEERQKWTRPRWGHPEQVKSADIINLGTPIVISPTAEE